MLSRTSRDSKQTLATYRRSVPFRASINVVVTSLHDAPESPLARMLNKFQVDGDAW